MNNPSSPFQLSNLSQSSTSSRPTIPYSQSRFARPLPQDWENDDEDEYLSDGSDGLLSEDDPLEDESHHLQRSAKDGIANSQTGTPADPEVLEHGDDDEGLDDDEETGLTSDAKARRTAQKQKRTQFDQRMVPAGNGSATSASLQEKKEADQNVVRRLTINGILIGLWYLFSLSISIYNKWMFDPKHLDFQFPLFTTSLHMVVQFSLASLVLFLFPRFRPRHDSLINASGSQGEEQFTRQDKNKPLMTWWFYATRLGPCGIATGLDIGLGNASLLFISLTFYTMCKSSSLAFVLIFAFLFRLETPSWRLVAIIVTMTGGVVMMVFGEVDFSFLGFFLVITAALFSGFRWALTQILLLRNPATSNPFSSIFYLAPIMCCSLLLIAMPVEGFPTFVLGLHDLFSSQGAIRGPLILLFPGIIAFLMTASEFALLQRTSVVTLSIAGIFKEVVTISAAAIVFGDPLTPINVSGLFVTIGAIAAYNYIKITKMREDALREVQTREQSEDQSAERVNDTEPFISRPKDRANSSAESSSI